MEAIQNLILQIQKMEWSDYVDIILVAFLLYKLFPMIRSTGASRIAGVVVAVLILSWLTNLFNLYTMNFIMEQVLAVGLIAIVVLFQPELRRMLDHLSGMKLKTLFGVHKEEKEMENVISQTVVACEAMSRERVGALIVFQRNRMLTDYIKTGTSIDAVVSEQLLRNIFFPKASLHDGAVIICDGRVTAAGCVLPLSDSDRLSADLGTRHRAGVGTSEVSDAVVVVVSEETGAISVAVGGMLKRHLAAQTLEQLLRNELCPEEKENKAPAVKLRQKLKKEKTQETEQEQEQEVQQDEDE